MIIKTKSTLDFKGIALNYLLKHYFKLEMDKKYQRADWRER